MDPRYPTGRFDFAAEVSPQDTPRHVQEIATLPARLLAAVAGLTDEQLDTPYRDGGWTVRQVVHHLPDSHLNAYVRVKLALTEDRPTIKPYDEAGWAQLPDGKAGGIEVSLKLLEALHERWLRLLERLGPDDLARELVHPDAGTLTVRKLLALYAWHGAHHVAHVTGLRERMGW